jgi:3-keto-disaccharide hydrolase
MSYRLALGLVVLCVSVALGAEGKKKAADAKPRAEWRSLFDGKTLSGWKTTEFGAHASPAVEKGLLVLPIGDPLTGVTREKDDVPHVNYEIELEAQRVDGHDFFVGLTFPVQDSHASLILGGWSGGVCGISSIDGFDASENTTTSYRKFDSGKWYRVRMRVQKDRLQAWLDDEQIVDADTTDKKISTRIEVSPSKPLGLATYMTKGAYRNIRIRELKPEELKAQPKADDGKGGVDPEKNRPAGQ